MKKTPTELAQLLKNRIDHFLDGMVTFDEMAYHLRADLQTPEMVEMVKESIKTNQEETDLPD